VGSSCVIDRTFCHEPAIARAREDHAVVLEAKRRDFVQCNNSSSCSDDAMRLIVRDRHTFD
jgi:hypothetical protein